jgi:hypothetical protein
MNLINPRHAVALALVGWYLMGPPNKGEVINDRAPLKEWTITDSFDKASDCTDFIAGAYKTIEPYGPPDSDFKRLILSSRCIATDDLRLAK